MPETTVSQTPDSVNGAVSAPSTTVVDVGRYRPKASTTAVHDAVLSSLAGVVSSAVRTAGEFVSLVEVYDRNATMAIRYGHLVDASECLEIAMTHLGQLKAAMSHRLRLEDEQNTGDTPF
jgi:hypothetical protein